ncbi:MAG: alkaline phosphatase [Deltaproteobacteria bacterium]|nr:alkaline phosphatase [Deltaproteobacteria bacterium]
MDRTLRRRLTWITIVLLLAFFAFQVFHAYRQGVRVGFYRVAGGPTPAHHEPVPLDFSPRSEQRLRQDFAKDAPVRNVIFLIADGMSFAQLTAARYHYAGINGRLVMERFPVAGWVSTHAINSLYTDSAASASALATGFKTEPLMLSQTPAGEPQKTILEAAIERGLRAGMITSSVIFDATPAAFASHAAYRRDYAVVTAQMATSGVEFLASELLETTSDERRALVAESLANFEAAGFRRVTTREELAAATGSQDKVLAWLEPGTITGREPEISLADLTDMALQRLSNSDAGFFLLIEDEEVDTGSHTSDLPRVLRGIKSLDEAAARAVEFAQRNGNTLVLVTADHETGGLLLESDRHSNKELPPTLPFRWSSTGHTTIPVPLLAYGPGAERLGGVLDNTEVPRILSELMGLEMFSPRHEESTVGTSDTNPAESPRSAP